ncbi:MAG: NAD-dependent epimerase/dehydratase family protein [bacterium]|nr:NAD-dependent epimerase/dehydratase family protein [bacterium]
MNILITGAKGFVGRNLFAQLKNIGYDNIIQIDVDTPEHVFLQGLKQAQFIYHLAGVNRPRDEEEYWQGNFEFTKKLVEILQSQSKNTPVVFTSSIQAEFDNPYGKSKKAAEELLIQYSKNTNAKVFIYRLPNVFGKWCKPNYNSVVATFCYNISRGIPIQIHDPEKELTLVYIDDVVNEFTKLLKADDIAPGYMEVPVKYRIKLKDLAEKIYTFEKSRKTLLMPSLKDEFDKKLYATFISYLAEDKFSYELEMKHDNRGWLTEFIKSEPFGQIFISKTKPGITRGNHWHHTKVEKFLVIQGEALVKLRAIYSEQIIEYKVSGEKLQVIDIPPGYTHSITNVGQTELITIFWASEIYNPNNPDTYYLEV